MDVTDKVAIVTGGGRGIGRGIALALARNGADVVIAEIIEENGRKTASEVSELGRKSLAIAVDVTDQGSVDRLVPEVLDQFDQIDILVNNAGIIGAPGWEQHEGTNQEDWDLVYEVNVKGVARVTDVVAPHMKERRSGKIVNIASVAARQGNPRNPAYNVSKAGVVSLTQAYALELAPYNINVNAVCPGLIWTPMWERIASRSIMTLEGARGLSRREVFERGVKERIPLGREQTPQDIGNLATFLASDSASAVTGQSINVDGGARMN